MRIIVTAGAVAAAVCAILLLRPDFLVRADDRVFDILTGAVSSGKPSGQVAIVEIDEDSLAQFGRWPWPRDLLAKVVRQIADRGAQTIVLDMMLHEPAANDGALAAVLSGRPVVLGFAFRFDSPGSAPFSCAVEPLPLAVIGPGTSWGSGFFHPFGALCSPPELSRAAAGSGFLNAAPDSDGRLRRVPLVMESGERHYASLALAAVTLHRHVSPMELTLNPREASSLRLGAQTVLLEGPSCLRLRFRGPRRTFPYIPVSSVLNGRAPNDLLQGKIVIVGGSALGLPNPLPTPVDPVFPDVEVQANAIDNLLQGDSFHRPANLPLWELLLAASFGGLAALAFGWGRSWWNVLIVLGAVPLLWVGCVLLLSAGGLLFSPLPATAVLLCQVPAVTLVNFVTERRRAERTERQLALAEEQAREVLRESEQRYRRLVENINDAIIVDDAQGRLVFANRRFREWFGLEGKDIRLVTLEDLAAPEFRDEVRDQRVRRTQGKNPPGQYEFEGVRPDGTRIWIEALVTNVEEDGRIIGTQSALRDLTERKRIEAQYLQAQKMESVGRLAGGIAHDFNNLLTLINGYSELLLTRHRGPSEDHAGLLQIHAAGERAAELTRNLLAFSRKQLAQPKPVDLNRLIVETQKLFGRLIGEDIELITWLSPALGRVMADSSQLHQVLVNLLVNARDAMPRGGKIAIETKNVEADEDFLRRHPDFQPGSYVCLRVSDTGTGMSEEVQRHLFEPFFTTKDPGQGTGLGLATVYGIISQAGGRIEVTSKLEEGATFLIYFPRIQGTGLAEIVAQDVETQSKGSETVLVVEDQDSVRGYIDLVLQDCGYHVLQAANGPDALALAERFPGTIHLLLTDIVLPLMSGRELAERLKRSRPEMKVLFASGYAENAIGYDGVLTSDIAYLPKPFGPEELTRKVRKTLSE